MPLTTKFDPNILMFGNDRKLISLIHTWIGKDYSQLIDHPNSRLETAYDQFRLINPEILIMDISSLDEFDKGFFEKIKDHGAELIVISSRASDAEKVIHYQLIDFLLKPVKEDIFKKVVALAAKKVEEKRLFHIFLEKYGTLEFDLQNNGIISFPLLKGRTIKLSIKDIIRLEADGAISRVYLRSDPSEFIIINSSIKQSELFLKDQGFFRIDRKHLINLDAINPFSSVSKNSLKIYTGEVFPIARRRQIEFIQTFNDFQKRVSN